MIQRTWMAAVVAVLLAGGSGILLAQPAASLPPGVIARVNGVDIRQAELDAVLKSAGPSAVPIPEAQRKQRQMEALALLIDNVLMRQFLLEHTAPITPGEVDRRLAEMEAGLKEQGKSLAEFCHDTNQTPEQLKASIADHMRWSSYAAKHVTDAVVAQYYRDNKAFFDKDTVKASHIVIRLPQGASDAEKQKARARLQELRGRFLADPRLDFAEEAKKVSQDSQAAKGGDLGWFPRKWVFDESFSRAAFATPVGQVSDVVETEYGMHLIKVTDRKPGEPSDLAKIKEAVREFCAEDMRQQILTQLRKKARSNIQIQMP